MNFLALVQRLHAETGRSTPAPTTVVAATGRALNLANAVADAWVEVQSERDWRWMRETINPPLTIGQQTYTSTDLGVASRFGRWRRQDATYSVYVSISGSLNSRWQMDEWQLDEFRQQYIYLQHGNTMPMAWAVDEQERILVGPAPADAYLLRVEYWKEPSKLEADADTPDMPDRFHLLVMWRALMNIAKTDAAQEILARAETNYLDLHDKLLFDQARLPYL